MSYSMVGFFIENYFLHLKLILIFKKIILTLKSFQSKKKNFLIHHISDIMRQVGSIEINLIIDSPRYRCFFLV